MWKLHYVSPGLLHCLPDLNLHLLIELSLEGMLIVDESEYLIGKNIEPALFKPNKNRLKKSIPNS